MKKTITTILIGLISIKSFAFDFENKPEPKQSFSLKLDNETLLTDTNGVFNLNVFLPLDPQNNIKIYLPNGRILTGVVKHTELFNKEVFKVFGELLNEDDAGFGFVLMKNGIFAGAVVFRKTDVTYVVKFDENLKGYVLISRPPQIKIF